ncbi:hypothetical protein AGMMS49944_26600 [Spirochaetia bacterium]|nr:hypothetical protein AGMMS49944_26600 [Spirochaetia bacterium]
MGYVFSKKIGAFVAIYTRCVGVGRLPVFDWAEPKPRAGKSRTCIPDGYDKHTELWRGVQRGGIRRR